MGEEGAVDVVLDAEDDDVDELLDVGDDTSAPESDPASAPHAAASRTATPSAVATPTCRPRAIAEFVAVVTVPTNLVTLPALHAGRPRFPRSSHTPHAGERESHVVG